MACVPYASCEGICSVTSSTLETNFGLNRDMDINSADFLAQSGPEVIKLFPCSPQLSMKFFLLINVKMPTIVGILTFMSGKNSILGLSEPKKVSNFLIFLYL